MKGNEFIEVDLEKMSGMPVKPLIDECASKRLRNDFPNHKIRTLDEVV